MTKSYKQEMTVVLGLLTMLVMFIALLLVYGYAPIEKTMGMAQKIFYFHVPSAFMAFSAYAVVFVASILYLKQKDDKYDRVASSAAEVGVIFSILMLLTGPIWARSAWGVWWTWEPRLTTALILFLIFIGYLMLRSYGSSGDQMKRYSAVVGIIGFMAVPFVYSKSTFRNSVNSGRVISSTKKMNSRLLRNFPK